MEKIFDRTEICVLLGAIICCFVFACAAILGISSLNYIGAAIALAFILFFEPEYSVLLIIFLCPNTSFVAIGGSSLSGYLSLVCFFLFLYKSRLELAVRSSIAVLAFITFVMISSILNGDFTYVFGFVKMASDILLLLLLIYNERDKVRKMVVLSYSYIYGAVLGGLLGLIDFLITGRGINVYGVARMDGIFGDGNYYSVAMAFAIALVLVLILHKNKISFIDVTALAILALLGFETISRGFLITFAVIGLIFIVYFVFSRQMKLIYKFSSIFSIALFAAIAISKTDILDRYVIRMTSKDIVSGNGRFDLWSYYLNSLFSSREGPFIGLGSSIKAIALHPTLQMEHNTYVQFLYSIGIVGSVLFLLVAVAFYKDVKMVCAFGKKSPLTFLPIVSTLCSVFFISAMTWENFIYPLFIGILVLLNLRKNDGRKNKYVLA